MDSCNETSLAIASKFENGLSESTVEKDLKQAIDLGCIEMEKPKSPGKRGIRPTQKVYLFLAQNTQSIMDRETAKKVFEDRKDLRLAPVNTYGKDRKDLRLAPVNTYGHNINRKETIKINSLKEEKEDFKNFQIVASEGPEFIKAIQESGLMEAIKNLIMAAGPNPEKETTSILKHFGKLNHGNDWNTQDKFITRFEGYLEKQHYQNRPKNETVTIARRTVPKISDLIMDRETVKKVSEDRKDLRLAPVNTYGKDRKDLRLAPVNTYGHNINRKETIKINSLKEEKEDFKNFQIVASEGPEFIKAIQESGLMEAIKNLIMAAGPNPEKETTSILKHFGKLNHGNDWNTQDKFITRFEGYLEKQHYQNRPKNETVTIYIPGRQI
jgi:hypothetical protein